MPGQSNNFYRAFAQQMLTRGIDIGILSVRLSVCPARSGIVSKRRNISSYFRQHMIA